MKASGNALVRQDPLCRAERTFARGRGRLQGWLTLRSAAGALALLGEALHKARGSWRCVVLRDGGAVVLHAV